MNQKIIDYIVLVGGRMNRRERMDVINKFLEIESDVNFEQAKKMSDIFMKMKQENKKIDGRLGVSASRSTSGLGFEFTWLHLETGWKPSYGRKPKIKKIKKGKSKDRYTISSVKYNDIEHWEIDLFEMLENRVEPLRKMRRLIGNMTRSQKNYLQLCDKLNNG